MNCSECSTPVPPKAKTCSSKCRRQRSRRLLRERADLLVQRAGTLIVLDAVGRAKLSALLIGDVAFAPEGIPPARWRGIAEGRVQVLPATEVRQIAAWYPSVTRALSLPVAREGDEPDQRFVSDYLGGTRIG